MPQNSYYLIKNRLKKTKRSKIKSIFLSIVIVFVSLVLILNISDLFSSIITSSSSLFASKKIEFSSYNVYAVSICDFDNSIQANQMSNLIIKQGGAGVVYNRGEFFVLTSSYPTLDCAQEVSQNLKNLGYDSKIITLNVDSVLYDYKGKNHKNISSCFQIFKNCYDALYDLTILLDKQKIDYIEVNSNLLLKQSQTNQILNQIQSMPQDFNIKKLCQTYLTNLSNLLNQGIKTVNNDNNYTSNLKQILIKIVVLNQEFVNQIKTIK